MASTSSNRIKRTASTESVVECKKMMINHPSPMLCAPAFIAASSLIKNVNETKKVTINALDRTMPIELSDDELLAMAEMLETKHKE